MKPIGTSLLFCVAAVALIAGASNSALSAGGQSGALVRLQSSNPGTPQAGNLNLSGVGNFGMGLGVGMNASAARVEVRTSFAGDGVRISGTGQNSPAYMLLDGSTDRGELALALWQGHWSNQAVAGDIVLRANTGALILQNGVASGLVLRGNRVGIGTANPSTGYSLEVNGSIRGIAQNNSPAGISTVSQYTSIPALTASATGVGNGGIAISAGNGRPGGTGIFGGATNTTVANNGIWAATDSTVSGANGLYCTGRLTATGTKSFRIDHPFDPANKYLAHYCAEGQVPLNIYTGVATTDDQGYATISLPKYFESINKDYRYTLTVIDKSDDFVLAKVVDEIENNAFRIRTSKPNVKVSWEVKGTRNDAWVREYGAPDEFVKPDTEIGSYQNPELFGMPDDLKLRPNWKEKSKGSGK